MQLKGIIFDFDGTLVNTMPVCYTAFRNTFIKFLGREYSDREIDAMFGPSEEGIIKRLMGNQWETCFQVFLEEYDQAHPPYAAPFPGIETALRLIKQRGIRLAVVSGKGPHSMEISLRHSGLREYFDIIKTGNESGGDKPEKIGKVLEQWNCLPAQIAYVGDSVYDIKASTQVGLLPLGAAWVATSALNSSEHLPCIKFHHVDELIRWIEERS
jgi:pyrophosphatase PpaX